MKILHTADWHLGKKLENLDRMGEHMQFLQWLIQCINENQIDVLLISGDIFDSGTPSNSALEMYYSFLSRLTSTECRHIIITGGNHDSVATLNAPKHILKFFNVHVVGGVPEQIDDELIYINNEEGELELIVAAVPFLRDRDLRISIAGETAEERSKRLVNGIAGHYQELADIIKTHSVPKIAMGHLHASGAVTSDSEREILIGGLGQMPASLFPDDFNYIALGHLHRPQIVNKNENIRYSGSPIPLSFSESEDQKVVVFLDIERDDVNVHEVNVKIQQIKIPNNRNLVRITGELGDVMRKILNYEPLKVQSFPAWMEIKLLTDSYSPTVENDLNEMAKKNVYIDALFIRQQRKTQRKALSELTEEAFELTELSPLFVFDKKCESENLDEEQYKGLRALFDESLALMKDDGVLNDLGLK